MSRSFILGFVIGLTLLGIAVGGNTNTKQKKVEEQKYQAEIADATPVQIGVLTEKQRLHSKLHNGAGMKVGGKTISEWMASYRGEKIVLVTDIMGRRFIPLNHSEPEIPEDYFGRFAQESDAVIRGRAINRISQITEDGTFLFTDYDLVVSEIFKDNTTTPIDKSKMITVTCLGGKIVLDDVILKAGGSSEATLPINDHDVLLFLKFIPETGSYKLTRYDSGFELNGISVRPLVDDVPRRFLKNEDTFLKTVRIVSNK